MIAPKTEIENNLSSSTEGLSLQDSARCPSHRSLLSLPDEILLIIVSQIEGTKDLKSFTLTCQKAQDLAEPKLYHDVCISDPPTLGKLVHAIVRRPIRGASVRNLTTRYKRDADLGFDIFAEEDIAFKAFPNLRSWTIETPCPNDGSADYEAFRDEGKVWYWLDVLKFEHLRSIQIHTHVATSGQAWFNLTDGKGSRIFQSQSLHHIQLSCADLTIESIAPLVDWTGRTNLRSLVFEECNISVSALNKILAIPKALQRFTLGERLHHTKNNSIDRLVNNLPRLLEALQPQSQSLRYFKQTEAEHADIFQYLLGPSLRRTLQPHVEVPLFTNLVELDIPFGSPLLALLNKQQPSLQTLRLHSVVLFTLPHINLRRVLLETLRIQHQPSLTHLQLVLHPFALLGSREEWLEIYLDEMSQECLFLDDDVRNVVWEAGQALEKVKIRMTVHAIRSAGFIPPFMHGEERPEEMVVYDSKAPFIFGSVEMGKWFEDRLCAEPPRETDTRESSPGLQHSLFD